MAAPARPSLADALAAAVPGLAVSDAPADLAAARTDSAWHGDPPLPGVVAWPASTAEVAALVRFAAARRVPVVPRGAGTGTAGGAAAVAGGLVVAVGRMARVLAVDPADQVAIVQPGATIAAVKEAAAAHGLWYAPDPASWETATIGGSIATNAGGICCVKYGVTREAVLSLEAVLADGSVIRTGGRTVKDVAGYDLTGLLVGSMGTLGIVTEATLRLLPAPAPRRTLLAAFPSVGAAGETVSAIVRAGIRPAALELLDRVVIEAVGAAAAGVPPGTAALLLVETDVAGEAGLAELAGAEAAARAAGATRLARGTDPAAVEDLWRARRMAHWTLAGGGARTDDVGVPRSLVPRLLAEIEALGRRQGMAIGAFGHAGDGNLHPVFVPRVPGPAGDAAVLAAREELYRIVIGLGGTITGEHGIGTEKRHLLAAQRGEAAVRAMRAVKDALDPLGILNPGKVLPDA